MALLLERAKEFLTESGKSAEAEKVGEALNVTVWPSMSRGMRQFADDLQTARKLARKTGSALHVEHALLLTFAKLKIERVGAEMMKFGDGFKPSRGGVGSIQRRPKSSANGSHRAKQDLLTDVGIVIVADASGWLRVCFLRSHAFWLRG